MTHSWDNSCDCSLAHTEPVRSTWEGAHPEDTHKYHPTPWRARAQLALGRHNCQAQGMHVLSCLFTLLGAESSVIMSAHAFEIQWGFNAIFDIQAVQAPVPYIVSSECMTMHASIGGRLKSLKSRPLSICES